MNNRRFLSVFFLVVSLAVFTCTSACHSHEQQVLRTKDRKIISFSQMISELKDARIVLVGETHDQKKHHEAQLSVIQALHRQQKPVAVGMEMFPAESQAELNRWSGGQTDTRKFIRHYYRHWQMPWPLYRDILLYVRDNRIPLLGLNVPASVTKRVAAKGFAALTKEEKRRLPPDITCDVDPQYMEFIRAAFRAHAHSTKTFIHFCETQKLWNRSMAWYLVKHLERQPGHTVVTITGVGHAFKRAIPAEVSDLSRFTTAVILPQLPDMPLERITDQDADYILLEG